LDTDTCRIVRLVATGSSSHRVTIPKELLSGFPDNAAYVMISKDGTGLRLVPVEIREIKKEAKK